VGAEVFCWQGVSSLLLSWCLLTIPIYHSFNTSVKLANCILEQSSDVPISLESIKLSSVMHSPHPPLFFFFFNCPLMNFHLHHETMKSFGQLREMTGALSVSLVTRLPSLWKRWARVDLYFKHYFPLPISGWKQYTFSWHNESLPLA